MLYHVGDRRHNQNIQINNVIGENKKLVFYGKKTYGLFGQPNNWGLESIKVGNPPLSLS